MPNIYQLLRSEHDFEHDLGKQKQYGKISLYDAGGDLSKRWYVYFSYRNPGTGNLERQPNLYLDINEHDSIRDRRRAAKIVMENLKILLDNGNSPFDEKTVAIPKTVSLVQTVEQAVAFALNIAKKTYAETAYPDFKSRLKQFEAFLLENEMLLLPIKDITAIQVVDFLNVVLQRSSARNRNNSRTSLSGFFAILQGNFIVDSNPVENIPILKSKPTKNKTFNSEQEEKLANALEHEHYYWLNLYVNFVALGMLRPIESCRLRIEDLSIRDRSMRLKAKNQSTKTKIIPKILFDTLPDLSRYRRSDYLFTPWGPGPWEATEVSRRSHFTDWFNILKKELGLSKEYSMYSYRHTAIVRMYRKLRETLSPFQAKSELMLITGHTTMKALESYLRDIDAELPEDFSHLLKKN